MWKKSVTLSFNRAQKHLKNQPGNKLDKVVAKGDASTSIKDGGVTVPNEVRGDHLQNRQTQMTQCVWRRIIRLFKEWLFDSVLNGKELGYLVLRVTQHSLHGSVGGRLDGLLDGGVRRRLGQTACQVHHWHVSHRHPEGHACQLAEETERQTWRIRRRLSSAWLETRVLVLTRWAQGWPCPRPWRHRWKRGWCSDGHNGHRARPWRWGRPLSSEWLCKRGPWSAEVIAISHRWLGPPSVRTLFCYTDLPWDPPRCQSCRWWLWPRGPGSWWCRRRCCRSKGTYGFHQSQSRKPLEALEG